MTTNVLYVFAWYNEKLNMKIVIGLGNPGKKYDPTRHNIGFRIVDALAEMVGISFTSKPKLQSEFAKLILGDQEVILLKPSTFMNNSGQAVRAVLDFYQLEPSKQLPASIQARKKTNVSQPAYPDLYVVHDDLDLELGVFKTNFGTGPKGHNGLLSLYDHLKTDLFWHVRVGVDNRGGERFIEPSAYVLSGFESGENELANAVVSQVADELRDTLKA